MVGRAVEIRQIVEKAQVGGLAVERVGALKLLVAVIIRRARSNVGGRPSRTSCRLIEIDNARDRKSTRLNSSHGYISYAVFCLKKKTTSHLIKYHSAHTAMSCRSHKY